MTESAIVAHPPANARDLAIIKGMLAWTHMTGKWDPEKGSPPSPKWPPVNERNMDSNQGRIIASSVCGLVIVTMITASRIFSRTHHKGTSLGWDDYFIILATVSRFEIIMSLLVDPGLTSPAGALYWLHVSWRGAGRRCWVWKACLQFDLC